MKKKASSQASWSILSEGVSASRVEAHIIRTHVNQLIEAIKEHPQLAEEIYKRCGDNFEAIPKHMSKMERALDRTNYALITMGSDWYRQRLTHEDREMVDLASKYNPTPFPSTSKQSGDTEVKYASYMKDLLQDILDKYLDELIDYDIEFDEDVSEEWLHRSKQDALFNGDFDTAMSMTKNRNAKEVIMEMKDMYNRNMRNRTASRIASPIKTVRAPLLIEVDFLEDTVEVYAPKSEVRNILKIAEGVCVASVSKNFIGSGANPLYAIHCSCGGAVDDLISLISSAGYTLIESA